MTRPFPRREREQRPYDIEINKGWLLHHWNIRSLDGASILGLWGSALTEKGAIKKADKTVARIRARNNRKPKVVTR